MELRMMQDLLFQQFNVMDETEYQGWNGLKQLIHERTGLIVGNDLSVFRKFTENCWNERQPKRIIVNPKPIVTKPVIKKKIKKQKKRRNSFYLTDAWRRLRYKVLKKYGGKCSLCGRSYREHGVSIHVDHIKPRSKYPKLELDENNLQLLCEDCNLGKNNTDCIDWRKN